MNVLKKKSIKGWPFVTEKNGNESSIFEYNVIVDFRLIKLWCVISVACSRTAEEIQCCLGDTIWLLVDACCTHSKWRKTKRNFVHLFITYSECSHHVMDICVWHQLCNGCVCKSALFMAMQTLILNKNRTNSAIYVIYTYVQANMDISFLFYR